MAYAPLSPATMESNPQQSQDHDPTSQSNLPNPPPAPTPPPPSLQSLQPSQSLPNPTPNLTPVPPMPPLISYVPPPASGVTATAVPTSTPSFRPVSQFSPIPNSQNPTLQIPGVQPPGVGFAAATASPAAVPISVPVPPQPLMPYQVPPVQLPNSALRPPYAPMANGYTAVPGALPQGTIPPSGLSQFPSPYSTIIRPAFPPRPPGAIGVLPRPPVPGIPGVRPIITPIIRPAISSVTPAEEPQTTVYVGKIAATVENDFMLSVLQFCGPVKSWKRPQDSTGTLRGFGFCEFESAEGVLHALRLLSKFSIDGQELVLNVKQATRDFLKRYVEKKIENSKNVKAAEASPATKEDESAESDEKTDPPKLTAEEPKKEEKDLVNKEDEDANFGIVTDEDREADREAMEKLTSMIEERLKTKPLPPPPPAQASGDGTGNCNAELPAKSKDGDFDADIRNDAGEEKNDEELTSENKQESENDRAEISSPDKNRRKDRRSRDRDRERDLKREKEREIERYERETERERIQKEREQRRRMEDAERQYEEYLKDWEYREREKEKQRQYEKEREKERERKRKKEIIYEEEDEDDDSRKRWRRSVLEEKRKKRLREKEDDLIDRQKEDEEIAEAKRRAEVEKQRLQERDLLKNSSDHLTNGTDKAVLAEEASAEIKDKAMEQDYEGDSVHENRIVLQNGGTNIESTMAPVAASDMQHSGNVTTKKLGFGLVGSGKRTAVPAVFNEEDDDDAHKEKKMRPLVPIDYSTEELQAVQPTSSGATPNLIAAAEFAKRISHTGFKNEKPDAEKERSRRTKDRNDGTKEKTHDATDREHGLDRVKTKDNKKLLDAKQLIDMIPKTKDELFSYEINWAVYDEHALHKRMRPWISKKITEFLGEEEATLVDYIVSGTQEHVEADRMLQLLQSILDEEAEMFVLKMWRMLIFEIKKVETGLSSRSRA